MLNGHLRKIASQNGLDVRTVEKAFFKKQKDETWNEILQEKQRGALLLPLKSFKQGKPKIIVTTVIIL